jgi:hypothetical protein
MIGKITISTNVQELLANAPMAVESFYPGHWDLMHDLERRASDILRTPELGKVISFFVDVAFLKQPYRIDRELLASLLSKRTQEIFGCIQALRNIDQLDYQAMEAIAKLPYFGLRGGRAFNSAVVRLVRPEKFAIIDWRNLAVMANASGFSGLISPPVIFPHLSAEIIVSQKSEILFSQKLYIEYNNVIRDIAIEYGIQPSEVDLILWTFSIQKRPFKSYQSPNSLFGSFFTLSAQDRKELKYNHGQIVNRRVHSYLSALKDIGYLSRPKVVSELHSIFRFIRDECKVFGQNKGHIRDKIQHIINDLDTAINSSSGVNLLRKWKTWEDMVNPSSPNWRGLNLPTDMVLEGYFIFEDLIPIREYFEQRYNDGSFEPRQDCD